MKKYRIDVVYNAVVIDRFTLWSNDDPQALVRICNANGSRGSVFINISRDEEDYVPPPITLKSLEEVSR